MNTSGNGGAGATAASRVGVYVCHCGTNIAKTVDVESVADVRRGAAERGGGAPLPVHVLGSRTGPDPEGHPRALPRPGDRRGLQPADARADVPEGRRAGRAQPLPLRRWPTSASRSPGSRSTGAAATAKAKALVSAAVRRVALQEPPADAPRPDPQPCAGRRRRNRRDRGGAADRGRGIRSGPGRAGAFDRRTHGELRQDLPDARLRRLHSDAEDGVGGAASEHPAA